VPCHFATPCHGMLIHILLDFALPYSAQLYSALPDSPLLCPTLYSGFFTLYSTLYTPYSTLAHSHYTQSRYTLYCMLYATLWALGSVLFATPEEINVRREAKVKA